MCCSFECVAFFVFSRIFGIHNLKAFKRTRVVGYSSFKGFRVSGFVLNIFGIYMEIVGCRGPDFL